MNYELKTSSSHEVQEVDGVTFLDLYTIPFGTVCEVLIYLHTNHFRLLYVILFD